MAVAAPSLAAAESVAVGEQVSTISDQFVSFALDLSAGKHDWNRFNVTDAGTIKLLRQFRPAVLRVGGSAADYAHFSRSQAGPGVGISGAQWNLTSKALGDLCGFASAIGWEFVFGLNSQPGYNDSSAHPWDDRNALELMRFVNETACPVSGYELGNELNLGVHQPGKGTFTPELQASHFHMLTGQALPQVYGSLGGGSPSSPLVIGPDVTQSGVGPDGKDAYYLRDFLTSVGASGWGVDRVTWHQYQKPGNRVVWYITPEHMDVVQGLTVSANEAFQPYAAARAKAGRPAPQLWLGETGIELNEKAGPPPQNSGGKARLGGEHVPGLDDGFAGALAFGDKLGLAMRNGHSVVVQQQLPNLLYQQGQPLVLGGTAPSVVMSSVWKRLAGTRVLSIAGDTAPGRVLRSYAVCSRRSAGAAVVVAINTDLDPADVTFDGGDASKPLGVVELAPFPDKTDYKAKSIGINGNRADIGPSGALPDIEPRAAPGGSAVRVLPRTMVFVEVPGVAACA